MENVFRSGNNAWSPVENKLCDQKSAKSTLLTVFAGPAVCFLVSVELDKAEQNTVDKSFADLSKGYFD